MSTLTGAGVTYTPTGDYNGADSFTFKVYDGTADSNTAIVSITVTAVNDAPGVADVPATATIDEMVPYTFTATATDPDVPANTLAFSLIDAPSGAAIAGPAEYLPGLRRKSRVDSGSDFTFKVRVTDNGDPVLYDEKTIVVTVNEVNRAPAVADVPATATIDEMVPYTFTATATDPDVPANTLAFSLIDAPSGAAIGGTSGVFTWTPSEEQGGTGSDFTFKVRVTDNGDPVLYDEKTIVVTVNEVNRAPAVADVPATATIDEMVPYTFTATATDPDVPSNTLAFSLIDAPSGAAIGRTSGVFTWTPSEEQGGTGSDFTFKVRVTDNGDPVLYDEKTIVVTVNEVNRAPVVADVPATATIDEMVPYTFTATATDPDVPANTLAFSLIDAPSGAAIGSTSGVFTWTPSEEQGGTGSDFTFKVRVTDNGDPDFTTRRRL